MYGIIILGDSIGILSCYALILECEIIKLLVLPYSYEDG